MGFGHKVLRQERCEHCVNAKQYNAALWLFWGGKGSGKVPSCLTASGIEGIRLLFTSHILIWSLNFLSKWSVLTESWVSQAVASMRLLSEPLWVWPVRVRCAQDASPKPSLLVLITLDIVLLCALAQCLSVCPTVYEFHAGRGDIFPILSSEPSVPSTANSTQHMRQVVLLTVCIWYCHWTEAMLHGRVTVWKLGSAGLVLDLPTCDRLGPTFASPEQRSLHVFIHVTSLP